MFLLLQYLRYVQDRSVVAAGPLLFPLGGEPGSVHAPTRRCSRRSGRV
jgi:hypothetical protein